MIAFKPALAEKQATAKLDCKQVRATLPNTIVKYESCGRCDLFPTLLQHPMSHLQSTMIVFRRSYKTYKFGDRIVATCNE